MIYYPLVLLSLVTFFEPTAAYNARKAPSKDAVLLSNINTLTLHANRKTSHRRVSALPQLKCVGPSKHICSLYQPDVMRCTNQGHDYDENDVQWTCNAQLPPEFKLGSTDVICEGYRDSDDPWILKGSCGVEYRMLLTDVGEEKFGKMEYDNGGWEEPSQFMRSIGFFALVAVIFLLLGYFRNGLAGDGRNGNGGWFGGGGGNGGGGGGGWGGWGPPGPPPPYDYQPTRSSKDESWRPGFWSGALGGAAAGYALGNRRSSGQRSGSYRQQGYTASPGPSRMTRESTGFGGSRRR